MRKRILLGFWLAQISGAMVHQWPILAFIVACVGAVLALAQ